MTDKRVAIVTGASRGIGFAIAEVLAKAGFNLAICATREATLKQAADALSAHGAEVFQQVVNVSQQSEVQRFIADTLAHFARIDVLVNNAGITRDNLSMRMKPEEWSSVIETNLSSVFYTSQAVLKPMMKARFGRIINISSVVASSGNPGQINYCAAKGGIDAMTRSLAKEVGSRNITVNAVAPGFIDTDMTQELGDKAKDALSSQIPLGRLGTAEDIASAVLYLALDSGSYVTGQVLHVNGGLYV
ncbi:MAG: 3-oxoacyl-ACP reductase [Zetaproteobacteria bacterium CG_4_9_14_3_um_filter_49_83]|nr:MAG: 3-oxoacyl-[acyl-carrier-protein] reductase [Zetaproteobacteria bacterium CG1_02_49_23]PIQ32749.1 MAG: 3-oxoacyl-ACP reductase [Zetaproteobacteria bacterium CG17_big_fil_post_rev_8_21_14_2_50_50_13]PIV29614.1 MAG: 3-oxoacyl-ACP reductase [Zetaproteobacteria bacterium CG02_land_8_20_14_3_00_50_9]PIY54938.1 MAG: 3-oxoacyl-ACP reductase [Zetaproteobacteria bacterium CG_4_10_14_0_8_um_filter_49_80]PJA35318.1 MAG: 3-oxoacyl-ACP reductase [Zetaproteobacteria bacterium CG_4_9_14_3_um_filter_49_